MRLTCSVFVLSIVTIGPTSQVWAQTNEEAFEQFQWQISTPGARANAMGRAFMASAGDASAAEINPAGLIDLRRPQISVEFRSTNLRVGRLAAIDSLFTGALTTSSETMNAASFVGAAVPLRGNKVAIALARHEFLDYKSSFHTAPRALPGVVGMVRAYLPNDGQVDFRAVTYAASIGVAVHESVRVGLTVSLDRLRADSLNTHHDIIVGPDPFDLTETAIITNQARVDDADTGVGLAVGAMYQPVRAVSLGFVFSKGPSFKVSEDFQLNSDRPRGVNGPLVSQDGFPKQISLNVPDQVSAGVALRPHPRVFLVFDTTYIKYSALAKGLTPIRSRDLLTGNDFKISDATEVHFGGELNVASNKNPVFLRAGVFTNHDHSLRFVGNVQPGGDVTPAQAQRTNAIERSVFNLGKHETTVTGTFGGGFVVGQHGQVDVAYVWKQQLVVSLGGRF